MDNQEKREKWLVERKNSIGGSESPVLLGLSTWHTPLSLYEDKITPVISSIDTIPMKRGRMLEPLVKELFQEEYNLEVKNLPEYEFLYHPEYSMISASPDALVRERNGDLSVLECKTAVGKGCIKWFDGVPDLYQAQLQHYMGIVGAKKGYIAALLDDRMQYFEFDRDDEFIKCLYKASIDFWNNHVVPRKKPLPITLDDSKKYWKYVFKQESAIADVDIIRVLKQRLIYEQINKQFKAQISHNELVMSDTSHHIINYMAGASNLMWRDANDNSYMIATYKPNKKDVRCLYLNRSALNAIPIDIDGIEMEQMYIVTYVEDNINKKMTMMGKNETEIEKSLKEFLPDIQILNIISNMELLEDVNL